MKIRLSLKNFPLSLQDKIYEIRYDSPDVVSKIVSYFPLSEYEKQEIIIILNDNTFDRFDSIFTDSVTDEEWNRTKDQIKKKFQDELFDIDDI